MLFDIKENFNPVSWLELHIFLPPETKTKIDANHISEIVYFCFVVLSILARYSPQRYLVKKMFAEKDLIT